MVDPALTTILASSNGKLSPTDWVLDGAAARHVTGQQMFFDQLHSIPPGSSVLGVGGETAVIGIGSINLPIEISDEDGMIFQKHFRIYQCLFAPGLPFNIISVKSLTLHNGKATGINIMYAV